MEFEYSGKIVKGQKTDKAASKTQVPKNKNLGKKNSFFSCDVQSTTSSEQIKRRGLPDGTLVVDGATGSELDRRGVDCNLPLWSANANLFAPEVLKEVHKHYLINGAKAITTNTFSTNPRRMRKVELGHLSKSLT